MAKFTKKIANQAAQRHLNWVIGCITGTDDPGYDLLSEYSDIEQELQENLEYFGVESSACRLQAVWDSYVKKRDRVIKALNKFIVNQSEINNG